MKLIPKNKTGGVVSTTIFGVGGLIIVAVVILVITTTIIDADLLQDSRLSTSSSNFTTAVVNLSGTAIGGSTLPQAKCVITAVVNTTGSTVPDTNYSEVSECKINYIGNGDY